MNEIILNELELKTFTEQDALDYCLLNNINPDKITILFLYNNKLTDISGIKLFKNIKTLWISNNKITDISVIKNLTNLEVLGITNLLLESNQIKYIEFLNNLKYLGCREVFKDRSVLKKLNQNINIIQ